MKLIVLRGLPGCGKSTIAEKLGTQLNSQVIYGDSFKREIMKNNFNLKNKEIYKYAYTKILEKIKSLFEEKKEIVIVEELFNNKSFVQEIKNFCKKNNTKISWFYVERDLNKLLETEQNRERKIKNTKEDFEKLEKELSEIRIGGEIKIDNNGTIESSVESILNKL